MNWDLVFAVLFYTLIIIFYLRNKKKFEVQSGIFFLYKTKLGLKLMNSWSKKHPRILKFLENLGIIISFTGMIFIFIFLLVSTIKLILNPASQPALAPVLPGIQVSPDLPVLGFWHWIISIFIIAVIHEFSHGMYARFHKIPVKSSGFAFMGPILAAFVEPDEKILTKSSAKKQLSVFSAGPFSNVLLFAVLFVISLFIINPLTASCMEYQGIKIVSIEKDASFDLAGLSVNEVITKINNVDIVSLDDFIEQVNLIQPQDKVTITTINQTYEVLVGENKDGGSSLGVTISSNQIGFKEGYSIIGKIMIWIAKLFSWTYIISLGVGLFNLLPLGPIDGGRMFQVLTRKLIKNERKARKIWLFVSSTCLLLIFINLLPYLVKLFSFVFNLI